MSFPVPIKHLTRLSSYRIRSFLACKVAARLELLLHDWT